MTNLKVLKIAYFLIIGFERSKGKNLNCSRKIKLKERTIM